jgi:hypothetical protein
MLTSIIGTNWFRTIDRFSYRGTHGRRLYNVLERFNITNHLLCITTDNARNNGTMRKELEELLNNLDINNDWSSESTKILCQAHVIQLVVKAILGAFNIKSTETEYSDDDINGRSISSAIAKVSYQA